MSDEIKDNPYWVSSAPIIFGNSGGALFTRSDNTFIGVPSVVSVARVGFSLNAIPHINYFIPYVSIYRFLDEQYYGFVFDAALDPAECHEARLEAQDDMRRMADIFASRERDIHRSLGKT